VYGDRYRRSRERSGEPVHLSPSQQRLARDALVLEIDQLAIEPAAMVLDAQHVHLLARFGTARIRPTVARLKAAATRTLRAGGFAAKRTWSKGCHMSSKPSQDAFRKALAYVLRHGAARALVHTWTLPAGVDGIGHSSEGRSS
jgi:hypothetical protein